MHENANSLLLYAASVICGIIHANTSEPRCLKKILRVIVRTRLNATNSVEQPKVLGAKAWVASNIFKADGPTTDIFEASALLSFDLTALVAMFTL